MRGINKVVFTVVLFLLCWYGGPEPTEASVNNHVEPKISDIYYNSKPVTNLVYKIQDYQLIHSTFFRSLGAEVNWLEHNRTIEIIYESMTIHYPIDSNYVLKKSDLSAEWVKETIPSSNPFIEQGKSYIPLAFTVKSLGGQIYYDSERKVTNIYDMKHSSELYWLYRITEAEAGGESFEGKVAVAATVLNRVKHGDWPNSIEETVFQIVQVNGISYYQFEPVANKYIHEVEPSVDTIGAVTAALNGDDPTNGGVVFYNPDKTSNKWVLSRPVSIKIGNHVFAY